MSDTYRAVICDGITKALEEALGPDKAREVGSLIFDLAENLESSINEYTQDIQIHDALIPLKEALAEHRHLSTGEVIKIGEDFEATKKARHEARLSMATYLEEVEKGLTTALGVSRFFLNDPETSQVNHLINQITSLKEVLRGHLWRRGP